MNTDTEANIIVLLKTAGIASIFAMAGALTYIDNELKKSPEETQSENIYSQNAGAPPWDADWNVRRAYALAVVDEKPKNEQETAALSKCKKEKGPDGNQAVMACVSMALARS